MSTTPKHPVAPDGTALIRCTGWLGRAVELLKVAKCPCCDGSGAIAAQIRSRQVVTREMALDAGEPSMEGSLYSDDEWEQQQCQWCDEKNRLISEIASQPNAEVSHGGGDKRGT
jgi:hypothetical protein